MPRGWLLDTNLLSETVRQQPDEGVMAWLDALEPEQQFVSVLTLGELRRGVLLAADAKRRQKLGAWLGGTLADWFGDRVLPIDQGVASRWAHLLADAGRPLPAIDSLLAATALHHELGLATRNLRDFDAPGLLIHSPWTSRG